ncbi:hypothetical protein R1sor_005607 [Riccia sorocarpa]|uniref:Nuclear pore complex protein n=1 Tax=Riccia sorocarpa TaxID=122646 RepID=A0ABD3HMA3_9MARC
MSMEDEAIVADIEAAGRLLSDTISRDFRFVSGDLVDVLDAARFASYPYSAPNKEWPPVVDVVNARELPPVLIERYNAAGGQGTALCGIFPAIRRAWATVDETLFLWRFDKWDGQCPEYCGEEQVICAVGLAKTIPGVFVEAIQYLVVVANPSELVLLGVCCSASSDGSDQFAEVSLQLLPEYTISTDGVTMTCITTTEEGRIFLGGRDGHLYELLYTSGMRWQSRCRKVCHTAGISTLLSRWVVPNALKFGAVDAIVEIVIDDERSILYTRTQESKIQVFDLGKSGDAAPKKIAEESRVGDQRDGRYGGSRAPAVRSGGRVSKATIISISPVSTTESKWLHLVAIASDGRRIYLSTAPSSGGGHVNRAGGKSQRPSVLRVVMTRPGPPVLPGSFSSAGTPGAPRTPTDGLLLKVEAAHYSSGVLILSDASPAPASRILVTTRDLTLPAPTNANPAINTAGTGNRSLKALRETVSVLGVEGRALAIADVLPTPDRAAAVEASVLEPGNAGLMNISTTDEEMTRARRLWARGDLATQHVLPKRRAIVLSTMGLMEIIFNRPVDILQRLLEGNSQRMALEEFFQRFGPGEAAAMCLLLAARLTSDEENMVPMSVMEKAAEAFEDARLVGLPQMQDAGAAGGQVTPTAGTGGFNIVQNVQDPEPVFSGAHEGLCLCAARLLRSVWELPVMISRGDVKNENGDAGGVLSCRLPAEAMQTLEEKIRSLEQFLRARRNQRRGLYGRVMGTGDLSGYGDRQTRSFANGQARDYGGGVLSGYETPPPTRPGVDRPPMSNKRQRMPYSPSELVAMEVRGLECIRRLLRRSGEALRLLQLLQHHHITRLSQSLEPQVRKPLSQLTFHQLVCSAEGEHVATRLVAALMEYYVAPDGRGTVDDISVKLREGCPSYYNESDYMFYQAVECLERAASVPDTDERENLAREALELLGKVPETADLLSVCQRFEDIMFYEAVVELPLRKARALDPAEDAFNESVEESQRQAALAARQQCYDVVTNALRTLKAKNGQRADMGPSMRPVPSVFSLDDTAREAYVRQIVQLGVRWPDRAFHRCLYQTMIELGMEEELLELAGPDFVPFLQSAGNYQSMQATAGPGRTPKTPTQMSGTRVRQPITAEQAKHLELLSRYYVRRRQHALAAHVLLRLAERRQAGPGDEISLQQRFEYLSNAVLQARSATSSTGTLGSTTEISDSGLLELLEGKLAVLRFQMKVRDELEVIASKYEVQTGTGNVDGGDPYTLQGTSAEGAHGRLAREKAVELGNELKSITQLYNDYAVPFELWEVCLEILNFSNYSSDKDNSVMRETWTRLLDQAIKRGGIAEACSVLRRVGPQLYPGGGGSLPLDSICIHLERAAQERVALGLEVVGEEEIGRSLLQACKGAAEPVQRTYDRLLASGAILPSPPLRLQMLRSVQYVMREWAQQVLTEQNGSTLGGNLLIGGSVSPRQTGSLNRGVKDKLCTAANRYMTEVRRLAMPQSQLESVSRGFQELEEMLLG